MRKSVKEQIDDIYQAATTLWYTVADDRMQRCGHPGVIGMTSDNQKYSMEWAVLKGAITALEEASQKLLP